MHRSIAAVAIHQREASSAAEANAACKRKPAYRDILREHPPATWHRRHLRTFLNEQTGFWMVEFELEPKADATSPSQA